MPKKRRKSIASLGTPDIPFPKVRVEWIDCVSDSGWATEKEFDKMKLARPVNEGWLYSKDKKSMEFLRKISNRLQDFQKHSSALVQFLSSRCYSSDLESRIKTQLPVSPIAQLHRSVS